LCAAAHNFGLSFTPLFHERYDLVFPEERNTPLAPFFETLQTGAFRQKMAALSGYETSHTGEQIQF